MLTLHSLRKTLPGAPPRLLLDAVDLSVAPGEYVAVIGESGAGKSTLLNLVAGLDRPDAGSVHFGAHAVSALDDDAATLWRRVEVGFVFQSFHVLPWLSLADNVALPLAQVALECGFSDQAHFTKAFAKASGLTPAKWRRCQICAT